MQGRLAENPGPDGLSLRGARIAGRIDLDNISSQLVIQLRDCFLSEGLTAQSAHLNTLFVIGCLVEHPSYALDLANLTAVRLNCDGSTIHSEGGIAIDGSGVEVDRDFFFRDAKATGNSSDGSVDLRYAQIRGTLAMSNSKL